VEVKLVEEILKTINVKRTRKGRPKELPKRLIRSMGSDCDKIQKLPKYLKIGIIAPHRSNRKSPKTQDDRELKRSKRRSNALFP
jgi:hypothetical protein